MCLVAPLQAGEPVPRIPLRVGLTIVTAISDAAGDYESIKRIQSEDAISLRLKYSSERPEPRDPLGIDETDEDSNKPRPLVVSTAYRNLLRQDLVDSHVYRSCAAPPCRKPFLRHCGRHIESGAGGAEDSREIGLTVYQSPLPDFPLKAIAARRMDFQLPEPDTSERGPVSVTVIVNGKQVDLPAIHARGLLTIEESEFYFLDDSQNPLTLRFKIGKESLTVVKIDFPGDVELMSQPAGRSSGGSGAQSGEPIEQSLANSGRAVVYGIYFSFASDRIREESEPVLKDIADALARHPTWKLDLEGHTDSIGGTAYNQDLSNRRASAVKKALAERYHVSPERLTPLGFGASRPKATNDTLEGRALNRRVELVKR